MPKQRRSEDDTMRDDSSEILDRFLAVCERDVDLLLLEEFNCSPSFCGWFFSRLGLSPSCQVPIACKAKHSVASNTDEATGESDLEIIFDCDMPQGRESVLVLLEDKVAARFTPGQAAPYQSRAKHLADQKGIGKSANHLHPVRALSIALPYGIIISLETVSSRT